MHEREVFPAKAIEQAEAAGLAAAQFCRIDPAFYIERSAMAGVQFVLTEDHGFGACFLDAEMVEASFLDAWLHASPGAAHDVAALLQKRGMIRI
jgi:hypothetical protein